MSRVNARGPGKRREFTTSVPCPKTPPLLELRHFGAYRAVACVRGILPMYATALEALGQLGVFIPLPRALNTYDRGEYKQNVQENSLHVCKLSFHRPGNRQ